MCGGSNILRWPVDETAILGSRMGAQLGRTLHWQGLVDEAKHNEANPGRAETKAAINAALWYLGGEAGSALGGGADAAGAGADAASAGYGAYNALNAAQIAEQGAPIAAGENVGTVLGSMSGPTTGALGQAATQAGVTSGLLGAGGSPTLEQLSQLSQVQNYAPVVENSVQAQPTALRMAGDYAARANTAGRSLIPSSAQMPAAQQSAAPLYDNSVRALQSGSSNGLLKNMALNMGTKMLTPQQQQRPMMAPPAPQGPQGPLNNPYQGGNPYQNSLSMGLTEEQKMRLRAMGYQV